jgi:phosphoglycolate phosphatase
MLNLQSIKLVVWDLDGTIIDSYGVFAAVLTEATELRGLPKPTPEAIRHNFHGSLDESIKGVLNMVDGEDFVVLLNDFLRIQEKYYEEPEQHVYADARSLVSRLAKSGAAQVIATNREHQGRGTASPHYLINNTSLKPFFSHIIAGEEAPVRKPHADVIKNVAGREALQGHHILVVGDQFVDAELAQNLGAQAIIVNRGEGPVPHLEALEGSDFLTVVSSLDMI